MSELSETTPLLKASGPSPVTGPIALQRTASTSSLHPTEPVIHLNSPLLVAHQPQPESPTKRIHPIAVVIPLFFSVLAITFCIVPIQQWLLLYVCRGEMEKGIFNGVFGWEGCRQDTHVQSMTAHWEMIFDLLSSVPTLISVPILGSLSDKIGRKPVMMIPIISTIISIGSVLIIAEYNLNLWVLALVKFLTGLMGSYSVLIIASFAYISDVTTVDERTSMFVLVEASFFLAFTIGPVLGGYLARTLTNGVIGVFHLTLFLEALVLFYIAIILSESLPKKIQSQNNQQRTCGKMMVSALKSTFSIFSTSKSASHNLMLLVMFAMGLCSGATGCFFLWAAFKFGWDSYDQGIYLFVSSLARMLAMVSLSPLLKTCLKNPIVYDIRVLQGSMLVTMISNVLLAFSTRGWMLIATSLLEGFGALATPTLRALLSKTVSADAQGSLFSGIQVIQQIGSIVSSSIFPNVWAGTVGTSFSSLFLFIQAFIYLLAFGFTAGLRASSLQIYEEVSTDADPAVLQDGERPQPTNVP